MLYFLFSSISAWWWLSLPLKWPLASQQLCTETSWVFPLKVLFLFFAVVLGFQCCLIPALRLKRYMVLVDRRLEEAPSRNEYDSRKDVCGRLARTLKKLFSCDKILKKRKESYVILVCWSYPNKRMSSLLLSRKEFFQYHFSLERNALLIIILKLN